jgi:hypothetical protein
MQRSTFLDSVFERTATRFLRRIHRVTHRMRTIRKLLQLLETSRPRSSNHRSRSHRLREILLPICCQDFRAASSGC